MTHSFRFGVLTEVTASTYNAALCATLDEEAARHDVALEYQHVAWASASREESFLGLDEVLSWGAELDGLIVLAGVFSHGVHGLSRLTQRWAPRPIVSIGYHMLGVSSVIVNNREGSRVGTRHLIDVHGCKQPLFAHGRKDSQESVDRYLGFRYALRDAGLLHDEKRVLVGDFTAYGAKQAFANLDPDVEFDAIVAANDDMALSLLERLRARGKRVPEDVAVIGFDNSPKAAVGHTPLTTLVQPFAEVSEAAISSLLLQSESQTPPQCTSIPVRLLRRASCGCVEA